MLDAKKKITIVALQGSVRADNNTGKALAVAKRFADEHLEANLKIIDPTDLTLPLPGQGASEDAKWIQDEVREADAIILATPEYHGSYSSVMKLLIDNLGFPSALKGKPVALLGVAAGRIGAIKALEHLRSVASHVGALVLPGPVSVANVRAKFDDDGTLLDEQVQSMIEQLLSNLRDYTLRHICPKNTLESFVREQ